MKSRNTGPPAQFRAENIAVFIAENAHNRAIHPKLHDASCVRQNKA